MSSRSYVVTGALLIVVSAAASAADSLDSFGPAITGGKPNLDLRLRYENVGQRNALDDANAYTVRMRLGYTTAQWNGFDAAAEYQGTTYLGDEDYDSSVNGKTTFSKVVDPKGSELNQAWLRYSGLPGTMLKFGRSRLILDNARFVGNVGWRQNEQTYDGFFASTKPLPGTTFSYAYLTDVNTIALTSTRLHAHLLNVAYEATPWLNVTAYDYLLDFDLNTAAKQDTQTPGLRVTGKVPAGPAPFSYTLEYAHQSSYKDAPGTIKAKYELAEAGYGPPELNAKLGYEVLGSNSGLYGLQTPLATLHAFQGWADVFLATPATGIRDAYAVVGGKVAALGLLAVAHRFTADSGGAHYGNEADLQATYSLAPALLVGAKYARYDADSFSVDTRKTWAWIEYHF